MAYGGSHMDHNGPSSIAISDQPSAMSPSRLARAVVALGLFVLTCCARSAPQADLRPIPNQNVLLITIDTLRQDRVGAYGNRSGLTPHIDRLAAAGVRYAHAFSPAPLTLPAHASILTGLLPRQHGVHNNTRAQLDQHVVLVDIVEWLFL